MSCMLNMLNMLYRKAETFEIPKVKGAFEIPKVLHSMLRHEFRHGT